MGKDDLVRERVVHAVAAANGDHQVSPTSHHVRRWRAKRGKPRTPPAGPQRSHERSPQPSLSPPFGQITDASKQAAVESQELQPNAPTLHAHNVMKSCTAISTDTLFHALVSLLDAA